MHGDGASFNAWHALHDADHDHHGMLMMRCRQANGGISRLPSAGWGGGVAVTAVKWLQRCRLPAGGH
jgi:hypothetical protein